VTQATPSLGIYQIQDVSSIVLKQQKILACISFAYNSAMSLPDHVKIVVPFPQNWVPNESPARDVTYMIRYDTIEEFNVDSKVGTCESLFFRSNRISNRIGRPIRLRIESSNRIELLITPIILTII